MRSRENVDPDDDLASSPLRALWRTMPDEDPPAGGLEALLAAAREKASDLRAASSATSLPAVASNVEEATDDED